MQDIQRRVEAVVFRGPDDIVVERLGMNSCGPGEILVKTLYTMVSSGTELRVLAGEYGAAARYPFIPGYSVVAEVLEIGKDVKGYKAGDIVSGRNPVAAIPEMNLLWGGQASYHIYTTDDENRPVVLPEGARPGDYVIAEISAISFRGARAANPLRGETAVVIGQGLIGAFSGAWLAAAGCRVIVLDIEQGRLDRAYLWGASAALNAREEGAFERVLTLLDGGADIVVESSGTSQGINMAYKLLKGISLADFRAVKEQMPRLVVQANYLEPVQINPFGFFPGEGVFVISPADRDIKDRQSVVEEIRKGSIRAEHFVQSIVSFSDAPSAYRMLRDDKSCNFSLVFDWTGR